MIYYNEFHFFLPTAWPNVPSCSKSQNAPRRQEQQQHQNKHGHKQQAPPRVSQHPALRDAVRPRNEAGGGRLREGVFGDQDL